jgi:hypothetical protein
MRDTEEMLRYAIEKQDTHMLVEWILEVTSDDVVKDGCLEFFDPNEEDEF